MIRQGWCFVDDELLAPDAALDDPSGSVEQNQHQRWIAFDYTKPRPLEQAGCLVLGPFEEKETAMTELERSVRGDEAERDASM